MYRSVTVEPVATAVHDSAGSCVLCTSLARRAASVRAARSSGVSSASARSSAAAGTRVLSRSTSSNLTVYSRTASLPRVRTASHTGRTASKAAVTSTAARGSTADRLSPVRVFGVFPRRSIRASTRIAYRRAAYPL